jgi:hypothetical protein
LYQCKLGIVCNMLAVSANYMQLHGLLLKSILSDETSLRPVSSGATIPQGKCLYKAS